MTPLLTALLLVVLALAAVAPWWPAPRLAVSTLRSPAQERSSRRQSAPADPAVVLDLAAAALEAGAAIPRALSALGEALGGEASGGPGAGAADGAALRRVAAELLRGESWAAAWAEVPQRLAVLGSALEPAWVDGVAAGPLLTRAADRLRAGQARAAEEAAARLGVRLVLPLGLCLLPSFVLLGLVPVVLAAGAGLFD